MRNTDEFFDSVSNSYTDFMDEYAKNAEGFVSNFGDGVAVAEFNIPPITPERKVPSEKLEEELSKKLANYSVIMKIPHIGMVLDVIEERGVLLDEINASNQRENTGSDTMTIDEYQLFAFTAMMRYLGDFYSNMRYAAAILDSVGLPRAGSRLSQIAFESTLYAQARLMNSDLFNPTSYLAFLNDDDTPTALKLTVTLSANVTPEDAEGWIPRFEELVTRMGFDVTGGAEDGDE